MEESGYILGHLLMQDIIAAALFFLIRKLYDLYQASEKVNKREGPNFDILKFYKMKTEASEFPFKVPSSYLK